MILVAIHSVFTINRKAKLYIDLCTAAWRVYIYIYIYIRLGEKKYHYLFGTSSYKNNGFLFPQPNIYI